LAGNSETKPTFRIGIVSEGDYRMRRKILIVSLVVVAIGLVGVIGSEARDYFRERAQQLANEKWTEQFNSAKALSDQGRFIDAEGALIAMLPETEKTFPGGERLFDILDLLGRVETSQRAFADAEPTLLRAVGIARTLPPGGNKMAVGLEDTIMLYQEWGRPAPQELYLREAIALFEKDPGTYAGDLAITYNQMADIEYRRDNYPAAISLLQKAIDKYPVYPGPHHSFMVGAYMALAQAEGELLRYADAERDAHQGLALANQNMSADEPAMLDAIDRAGYLYSKQHKYDIAEPMLKHAYEAAAPPANAKDIEQEQVVSGHFAELLTKTGRGAEAEAIYKRELADSTRILGADDPHTGLALVDLGTFYRDSQDQEHEKEAESILKQAVAQREKLFGPDDVQTANARSDLALAISRSPISTKSNLNSARNPQPEPCRFSKKPTGPRV
jgi:tetratricopeptide (TPR) repeat protein